MVAKTIGIVGCGWLGKALATKLVENHHHVVASTQSKNNIDNLVALGLEVECFSTGNSNSSYDEKLRKLFQQNCLIIAIPPMIRQGKKDYPEKIKRIVELAQAGQVKQLILISSTAVYNGLIGNVDETAVLDLSEEKVSIIHKAEQEALSFTGDTIILRLAGLVGPERHPGKFLKAGRPLVDPQATTNLIHQEDAVGLLFGLINYPQHTAIYNGCSSKHSNKQTYYQKAATTLDLSVPKFKAENTFSNSKKIIAKKVTELLDYEFVYDDLLLWLDEQ